MYTYAYAESFLKMFATSAIPYEICVPLVVSSYLIYPALGASAYNLQKKKNVKRRDGQEYHKLGLYDMCFVNITAHRN